MNRAARLEQGLYEILAEEWCRKGKSWITSRYGGKKANGNLRHLYVAVGGVD
jgi:hypothetical protein